jgi:hypothetical protein
VCATVRVWLCIHGPEPWDSNGWHSMYVISLSLSLSLSLYFNFLSLSHDDDEKHGHYFVNRLPFFPHYYDVIVFFFRSQLQKVNWKDYQLKWSCNLYIISLLKIRRKKSGREFFFFFFQIFNQHATPHTKRKEPVVLYPIHLVCLCVCVCVYVF